MATVLDNNCALYILPTVFSTVFSGTLIPRKALGLATLKTEFPTFDCSAIAHRSYLGDQEAFPEFVSVFEARVDDPIGVQNKITINWPLLTSN